MKTVAQCLLSDISPQVPIGARESRPSESDVPRPRGADGDPRKKLTDDDVDTIRRSKESGVELARRFGVTRPTISRIKCGRSRAVLG